MFHCRLKTLVRTELFLLVFIQCLIILVILNVSSVLGSGLSTLHVLPHLILTVTLKSASP